MLQQKLVLTLVALTATWIISSGQDTTRGLIIRDNKPTATGRVHALVVGVSDYKYIPKLQYADVDALDFYNYLRQSYPSDSAFIRRFLNGEATRDAIAEHLYTITDNAKKGDKVYIYLSGHGDIEHLTKTDNSLFLLGGTPEKNYLRKTEYIDLNLLRHFFAAWQEQEVKTILIVDACHAGALSGGEHGRTNTLLSLQQNWKNEIKLLSCQPNELSLEGQRFGGGRGLFSYYLTLGLRGMADKDKNKTVSLLELETFLRDSVAFYSDQNQLPDTHGDRKFQVSQYQDRVLKIAKTMLAKKLPLYDDRLDTKSGEKDVIAGLITNEKLLGIYHQFALAVEENRLMAPATNCAMHYFRLFSKDSAHQHVVGLLKTKLLDATQAGFYALTERMYNDDFSGIPEAFLDKLLAETSACLELYNQNHYSYNKLLARQEFLASCKRTFHLDASFRTDQYAALLRDEIATLKKAVQADPMQPYLYLRMADYALYTSQFNLAVDQLKQYVSFLPRDEYAYNKLGMAYTAMGRYQEAYDQFKNSVRMNNRFGKGYYNLYVVCTKMNKAAEAAENLRLATQLGYSPAIPKNEDSH
jgi:tetratricopeptide (TPR) repeat protein